MNTENRAPSPHTEHFARLLTSYLTEGTENLPYEVTERLRAARARALTQRPAAAVAATSVQTHANANGTLTLGGDPKGAGRWWSRLGAIAPLIVLVAGFVLIQLVLDEVRTSELAAIDAELLSDELPPQAFTDPGFVQYLRSRQSP